MWDCLKKTCLLLVTEVIHANEESQKIEVKQENKNHL